MNTKDATQYKMDIDIHFVTVNTVAVTIVIASVHCYKENVTALFCSVKISINKERTEESKRK